MPRSRFLQIEQIHQGWCFRLALCLTASLGLALREHELRQCVERHLRRLAKPVWLTGEKALILHGDIAVSDDFVMQMDRAIELLAKRPLSPRVVERVLGITGRERIRWGKDGRLPISGTASIRRSRVINLSTHPVDAVARLAADPSIIAAWRLADDGIEPVRNP